MCGWLKLLVLTKTHANRQVGQVFYCWGIVWGDGREAIWIGACIQRAKTIIVTYLDRFGLGMSPARCYRALGQR